MVAVTTTARSYRERLDARYEDLAPAERRVAEQLLQLGTSAVVLSAAALGALLGTSDATVIRTAKALGYSSLHELRHDLIDTATPASPDTRLQRTLEHTEPDELLASFAAEQVTGLQAMARNVDRGDFAHAVDLLWVAQRVVWRGVGPTAHLAGYGALQTNRIGKRTTSMVQTGTSFADELLGVRADDAVILLAYGPLQPHVSALLGRCAQLTTPVVLVTDTLGRKLAKRVAVTLRSGRGRPGEFASHSATLVLIEALTLAVAARDEAAATNALHNLNDLRAAIAGRRLDVDS